MKRILLTMFISMSILFFIITFLTMPRIHANFFEIPIINKITKSAIFTDALFMMMSTEVPQLETALATNEVEVPQWSKLLLEGAAGVTPRNFSSLLNLELPGKNPISPIQLAATSSHSDHMPVESPPPDFEELLKEDAEETKEEKTKEQTTKQEEATIFIYHSHSWEAFLPLLGDKQKKPSNASSTNNSKNIVMVGSLLSQQLEKQGIPTFHDTTNVTAGLHAMGGDYYDSYDFSRKTVQQAISNNKNIQYFIDIHRDAQRKDITTATIDNKPYAKLYFIVGIEHKNYKQNLAFVEQLNQALEAKYPGISRGIFLKDKSEGNGVYNQDLSKKSILIEIGGVDNNKEELQNTSRALAEVISEYHSNAKEVN
ncbi:MAG: stage II sporulation protein P [Virgibacillus proomii]|jgi:stage II sporulation protein P